MNVDWLMNFHLNFVYWFMHFNSFYGKYISMCYQTEVFGLTFFVLLNEFERKYFTI